MAEIYLHLSIIAMSILCYFYLYILAIKSVCCWKNTMKYKTDNKKRLRKVCNVVGGSIFVAIKV